MLWKAPTQDRDQPFLSCFYWNYATSQSIGTTTFFTENSDSISDDSGTGEADELNWISKVLHLKIQKVQDSEENWDTKSEFE